MVDDIVTAVWAECKTHLRGRASRSRLLVWLLTPVMLSTEFPVS